MRRKTKSKEEFRGTEAKEAEGPSVDIKSGARIQSKSVENIKQRAKIAVWKKLLFTLIVNLVILAGVESTYRILGLGKQPDVAYYIVDWSKTWDSDFYVMSSTDGEHQADINRDGLRDRDHQIEKTAGATRIVCLGDSVTFGYMVPPSDSYPAVLQRLLNEQNEKFEVFNVALPGWSTRQERYAYERIARQYKPDYVILGVCLNDIPELRNNLAKPPAWLALPYRHSAFVRAAMRPHAGEINGVEELFIFYDEPRIKDAWSRFFDEVRLLDEQVTDDGAELIVMLFPFRVQVMPNAPEPIPQQTMAQFVAREEIPYLDMLPTMQLLGWDGYIDYDHLTPQGATAVAQRILASDALKSKLPDTSRKSPSNSSASHQ